MPRELELATIELVRTVLGGQERATPEWLQRPAAADPGRRWRLVRALYAELTVMELPDLMPSRERRKVDCVLQRRGEPPGLLSSTRPSISIGIAR